MMCSSLNGAGVFGEPGTARPRAKLSFCCALFVVAVAGSSGCVREVPVLDEPTTTSQSSEPEEGPGDETADPAEVDETSAESTQDPQGDSTPTGELSTSSSQETTEESTSPGGESSGSSSGSSTDESSSDSTQDSGGEDTQPDPEPDDGKFDFVDALSGPRPCSDDKVQWTPVEKYRGGRLSFPATAVKGLERAVLSGPCDATLIGPDLAITGAQCRIKPGYSKFALHRQADGSGTPRKPVLVKVDSIIETKFSATGGYEYTIFRLSKAVGSDAGWVKMAALRLNKDELVGMVHAPKDSGEVFSAGTVLASGSKQFVTTRSLHAAQGSQGAGVIDAWGFLVATHMTGSCCDGSQSGCAKGKELGWQSGLLAAFSASPFLRSKLSAWLVGGPGDDFASDGTRIYGIQPGGQRIWKYTGTADTWEIVGPAADTIYAGGGRLYARHNGQVSSFAHSTGAWEVVAKGLSREDVLDVDRKTGDLYRLPADRQSVQRLVDGRWDEIGGPASSLFAIHDAVLAESPDGSAVWRWNPKNNKWQEIGPGGIAFVQSADGTVYRHDQAGVFELRGSSWSKLGGPVKRLAVGGAGNRTLFATNPKTQELMQYNPGAKTWDKIGRPSRRMYTQGSQLFVVDDISRDLIEYRPQ